jgi:OHCU decarboxylase
MDRALRRLNQLPANVAEAEFLTCCGSTRWARQMADARPFANSEEVSARADAIWAALGEQDWLEAFRAHPKIGERKATAAQSHQAANWSAQEQSQAQEADDDVKTAIAARNATYENRFGFIFIICATGKSADEILTSLNQRLTNNIETELRIAAAEQQKITRLRLKKLLQAES